MCNRTDVIKDDFDPATKTAFYVLFFLYFIMMALTLVAAYCARQKLRNKAMLSFYLSAFIVVLLRLFLFIDPLANYCVETYVVLLNSFPTYIYLVTGLSLFLMLLETILKYKNL